MPETPWKGNQLLAPLSDSQLETYLQYVSLGTLTIAVIQRVLLLPSGRLTVLKTLIRDQTSKIPWGSLACHYSDKPLSSLYVEDVFEKLATRSLGRHCLEMVPLFAAVLRDLDYDLYMTGARISAEVAHDSDKGQGFPGWSHIILIVIIDGQKYAVDPQYVEITELVVLNTLGGEISFNGIPMTIFRLRYCALSDVIPQKASNSGLMTWIFEYKRFRNRYALDPVLYIWHGD